MSSSHPILQTRRLRGSKGPKLCCQRSREIKGSAPGVTRDRQRMDGMVSTALLFKNHFLMTNSQIKTPHHQTKAATQTHSCPTPNSIHLSELLCSQNDRSEGKELSQGSTLLLPITFLQNYSTNTEEKKGREGGKEEGRKEGKEKTH